jgi:hypothetical protein
MKLYQKTSQISGKIKKSKYRKHLEPQIEMTRKEPPPATLVKNTKTIENKESVWKAARAYKGNTSNYLRPFSRNPKIQESME